MEQTNGITLTVADARRSGQGLLALLFSALWMVCLLQMAELSEPAFYAAACLPCVATALAGRTRNVRRISLCLLVLGVVLLIVSMDGLGQLANRLFAASEARQAYSYDLLPVSGQAAMGLLALAALSLTLGAICTLTINCEGGAILALLVLLWGMQIYLGVFPADVVNVLLAGVSVAMLVRPQRLARLALPLLMAAVFALFTLFFPAPNPTLSVFSENVRDFLDTRVEQMVSGLLGNGASSTQAERRQETEDLLLQERGEADASQARRFETAYEQRFAGAQAGMTSPTLSSAAALAVVVALLLLIPLGRFLRRRSRFRKRMRSYDVLPCVQAVDGMLREAAALVSLPENTTFYALSPALLYSDEEEWTRMLQLWEQAAYGSGEMDEESRQTMRGFLHRTLQAFRTQGSLVSRLRTRLYLHP